ncbi:hypothetical protein KX816_11010 [Sphingosinicellaceae bacterium]|nr:hypothetical protein KX816_11010 [Sphingosinicellaceae bacterium]
MRNWIAIGCCVALAGCGGRVAKPVMLSNNFDAQLTCEHLAAERAANRRRVADLTNEKSQKPGYNIGILLVSPLFLDFSNSVKTEVTAIAARDQRLGELEKARSCGT